MGSRGRSSIRSSGSSRSSRSSFFFVGRSGHRHRSVKKNATNNTIIDYDTRKASEAGLILLELARKISTHKVHSYDPFGLILNRTYDFYPNKKDKPLEHDPQEGIFNGYRYIPLGYRDIKGSMCTNNMSYSGIVFNEFKCPIEGFRINATSCCGPPSKQFCCTLSDFAGQQIVDDGDDEVHNMSAFDIILTIFGILSCFCLPFGVWIYETYKNYNK